MPSNGKVERSGLAKAVAAPSFPSYTLVLIHHWKEENKEMTFKEILAELVREKEASDEPRPVTMQHDFAHGEIKWRRGDKFNYRFFAALLLLDKEAAKQYFRTTS